MPRVHALTALLTFATLLSGCVSTETGDPPSEPAPAARDLVSDLLNDTIEAATDLMTFQPHVVTAAVSFANDLYEPTIEVSDAGVIYITGHTILVDTTGAPVFASRDDGRTWSQLPWFQDVGMVGPMHGATPPPSDEIFLAAGDDGWLYGVDITLATYPINAWSGEGTRHAYHNPNGYDEAQAAAQTREGCNPVPAKDRPWGAYEGGTLFMVSNPAGGRAQIGVMDVPPAQPAAFGAPVDAIQWNLCAGPGGSIPGIPDIRADGLFAAPQLSGGALYLVVGNKADIMATETVQVFPTRSIGEITSVYGIAAFDTPGTLFVGITNNTWHMEQRNGTDPLGRPTTSNVRVADNGTLQFAVSVDDGVTFVNRTYTMPGKPIRHFYMDANEKGPGALVVWAVDGNRTDEGALLGYDWYVGHLQLGADGRPELGNVNLAIQNGPQPSAHVTGAAVGPDGRAYLAMYEGSQAVPLSVYVQRGGPGLPALA